MAININSFNCAGIANKSKRNTFFKALNQDKNDIIFLQETHATTNDEKLWQLEWEGKIYFANNSRRSCGVAILFKKSLNFHVKRILCDPDGRFLIINTDVLQTDLILVNIYAPNSNS